MDFPLREASVRKGELCVMKDFFSSSAFLKSTMSVSALLGPLSSRVKFGDGRKLNSVVCPCLGMWLPGKLSGRDSTSYIQLDTDRRPEFTSNSSISLLFLKHLNKCHILNRVYPIHLLTPQLLSAYFYPGTVLVPETKCSFYPIKVFEFTSTQDWGRFHEPDFLFKFG